MTKFNKFKRYVLFLRGLPKTILFNFYYFPFQVAIKLPVLVSHRVWLMDMSGKCELGVVRFGIVKIGFGEVGIFDRERSRSIWQVHGLVKFKGSAQLGHGSRLSVHGELQLGDGFIMTAESAIVAHEKISIGDGVIVSWDVLLMDTDVHEIIDMSGRRLNNNRQILIGNKVWIGCRSLILKGVQIADGVIIAAGSTVSKSLTQSRTVVGGAPTKVLREDVQWRM